MLFFGHTAFLKISHIRTLNVWELIYLWRSCILFVFFLRQLDESFRDDLSAKTCVCVFLRDMMAIASLIWSGETSCLVFFAYVGSVLVFSDFLLERAFFFFAQMWQANVWSVTSERWSCVLNLA